MYVNHVGVVNQEDDVVMGVVNRGRRDGRG